MQETRVEYFRGKDFTTFMRNHPEVREILGPDKDLEVEDIVNTLLSKNLVIRCDRVWKTVRPGKKKLSSWPAHLEIHRVSTTANEEHCRLNFLLILLMYCCIFDDIMFLIFLLPLSTIVLHFYGNHIFVLLASSEGFLVSW